MGNNNDCDNNSFTSTAYGSRNSLIYSVRLLLLFLVYVQVPAFTPTTQTFQRSTFTPTTQTFQRSTRSTIYIFTTENRRKIKLFKTKKDDENSFMQPTEKDASDDNENGINSAVGNMTTNGITTVKIKPQVVPQRWIQLAYLSLLALLSDWVCFSVAAAPSTFESNFGHSAASIIDIFLFTNVATSFFCYRYC